MKDKIQSFWFGGTLSTMERLSILSFLKNGHSVDIYSYDNIIGLPEGANQVDANQILEKDKIFFDSSGGIAAFSDWFRYKLLYDRGGWWIDMDVICLQPFDISDDFCFATENYSSNYETGITCCVIKSQAKAKFLEIILDHINSFKTYKNIEWGQFGPKLIHAALMQFECGQYIQPVEAFCPVDWTEMKSLVEEQRELPINSLAIHMWNNLWRINNMDKDGSYHPHTIYERLKSRYVK
ncbi:glycosyltransferase [Sphingobacterium thalpophilum]|uniref:glycosyltransferase n=1 Tax=Sphingobacterium thalpophilum TaxID=259 RepID=UPI0031CFAB36